MAYVKPLCPMLNPYSLCTSPVAYGSTPATNVYSKQLFSIYSAWVLPLQQHKNKKLNAFKTFIINFEKFSFFQNTGRPTVPPTKFSQQLQKHLIDWLHLHNIYFIIKKQKISINIKKKQFPKNQKFSPPSCRPKRKFISE